MTAVHRILFAVCCLVVGACADRFSLEGVECAVDRDCASGQTCELTRCVGQSVGPCALDTDCPTGQSCQNEQCVERGITPPGGDGVSPTMTRYFPSVGNFQLYPDTRIELTFSEQLDPSTVTTETIQLIAEQAFDGDPSTANQPMEVTFEIDDNTVTLLPDRGPLPEYVADLTLRLTSGVLDMTGEPLFPERTLAFRTLFAEPSAPYRIHLSGSNGVLGLQERNGSWELDIVPSDSTDPSTLWSIAWFTNQNYLIQSRAPGQLGRIEGGDGRGPTTVVRGENVFTGQQFVFTPGPARVSSGVGESALTYQLSTVFQGVDRPLGLTNDEGTPGVFIRDAQGSNEFWWFERMDMSTRSPCAGNAACAPWACETDSRSCFTFCISDDQCSGATCVEGYCEP